MPWNQSCVGTEPQHEGSGVQQGLEHSLLQPWCLLSRALPQSPSQLAMRQHIHLQRTFQGKSYSLEVAGCIHLVGQYALFIRELQGRNIDF